MFKTIQHLLFRIVILELVVGFVCVRWFFPTAPSAEVVQKIIKNAPVYKTSEGHAIIDPKGSWLIYDKNGEVAFKISDRYVVYKDGRIVSFAGAAPLPRLSDKEVATIKKQIEKAKGTLEDAK